MNYDDQYYFEMRSGSDNYPLLNWAKNNFDATEFDRLEPIEVDVLLNLTIGPPEPEHPEFVDFHKLPEPVYHKRIRDVLEKMDIKGIQLFEAQIWEGEIAHPDYYIMNVFNVISCMHRDRSKYEEEGMSTFIDKLSLDEEVLDKIPEDERLIFIIEEDYGKYLFHQRVVDAIMAINPKGIRFTRVDQWGIGSAFD